MSQHIINKKFAANWQQNWADVRSFRDYSLGLGTSADSLIKGISKPETSLVNEFAVGKQVTHNGKWLLQDAMIIAPIFQHDALPYSTIALVKEQGTQHADLPGVVAQVVNQFDHE
ncbi:MAG: hypothetical protein DID92_2727743278 [Candidatus Nitrotoga sp. SPKER]|nr:MAG: hypothetical protein DID92_2727743278 [Candidatus Nitrotoga sp. SPKER]